MKKIKVQVDYECYPIWCLDDGAFGDISPDTIPVSQHLRRMLLRWESTFNLTLNRSDPLNSGFISLEEELAFENEGMNIWLGLISELGAEYEVLYHSQRYRRLYEISEIEDLKSSLAELGEHVRNSKE